MSTVDRREFFQRSRAAGAGIAALASLPSVSQARQPAGDDVTLAIIGVRGRGRKLMRDFAAHDGCRVAYLCDVDEAILGVRSDELAEVQGSRPSQVQDFRRALDDPDIDAVVIATPDHWHALATVWACQAGKHVYVEKPVSHTPWEGRKMVEAARKYDRVVQVGTQNRSAPYNLLAKQYLDQGQLGAIHMVRVCNQKYRPNPAPVLASQPPAELDWDMWCGPATAPHYSTNIRDHWNCLWEFSGGDIINDAVHQLDLARWLIGKDFPTSAYSTGGRFSAEGIRETPDTQVAVYEFDDLVMNLQLTLFTPYMLKSDPGIRDNDLFPHWPQNATRIEIYGTEGMMVVGRMGGGWQVFHRPHQREPVVAAEAHGRFPDPEHQLDFLDAVRTHRRPAADIEEGHRSTLLCQLANISYRLGGRKLHFDAETETICHDKEATALMKREYRSAWAVPAEV